LNMIKNKKFSKEFKYETVRRFIEEGHSLENTVLELKIPPKKLLRWKREYIRIVSWPIVFKKGCF